MRALIALLDILLDVVRSGSAALLAQMAISADTAFFFGGSIGLESSTRTVRENGESASTAADAAVGTKHCRRLALRDSPI